MKPLSLGERELKNLEWSFELTRTNARRNQPWAFRLLFREQFPEQVGIVAFPLFPVPIPRSLKVRGTLYSERG